MSLRDPDGVMVVPPLTAQPRKGYSRGAKGVEQILRKSEQLLVDEGAGALTLRRIAAECGMKQSNLLYYFKSKNALILALIDAIAQSYRLAAEKIEPLPTRSAQDRLRQFILIYLDNVTTRRTTRIFTELWAMASRDAEVRARLKAIYDSAIDLFAETVGAAYPHLSPDQRRTIALYIVTVLEGHTVTVGHDMSYTAQRDALAALVLRGIEGVLAGETGLPDQRGSRQD